MKKALVVGFTVIISLLLVLSGCGGAGATSSVPPGTTPAAASNTSSAVTGPNKLVFTTQPGTVKAGQPFTVVVSVQDSSGDVVATAVARISLLLYAGNDASLSGTTTVVATNGISKFSDLTIDKAGTGYTLKAIAVQATAESAPFDVSP